MPNMRLNTNGIVLSSQKIGESSIIVSCITNDNGIISGIVKIRKDKGSNLFERGNLLRLGYYSRDGTLGVITGEELKCYMLNAMHNGSKMHMILSVCSMISMLFRDGNYIDFNDLFDRVRDFFDHLLKIPDITITSFVKLIRIYLHIMGEAGYGLDLSKCVATGIQNIEELVYLSPKSGAAVSRSAGILYEKKMFKLPKFFLKENVDGTGASDIINGFEMVSHFMNKICTRELNRVVSLDFQLSISFLASQLS